MRVGAVGISGGDGKTVEDGGSIGSATANNVVAVIRAVSRRINVPAENRFIRIRVAVTPVTTAWRKAAVDAHVIYKLKSRLPVTGAAGTDAVRIRVIRALGQPDIIPMLGCGQGILQVIVGVGPACSVIVPAGTDIDITGHRLALKKGKIRQRVNFDNKCIRRHITVARLIFAPVCNCYTILDHNQIHLVDIAAVNYSIVVYIWPGQCNRYWFTEVQTLRLNTYHIIGGTISYICGKLK